MSILVAIVALCLVIALHEAGHYLGAVATGMKVDRFSVFGIGPVLVRLGVWRGTEFVISAIPFGAYVQIRGMEGPGEGDPSEEALAAGADDPSLYCNKGLGARFLALFGGPGANYLTAMVVLFAVFLSAGVRGDVQAIRVTEVSADSPAMAAGLQEGDELLAVGTTPIDFKLADRAVSEAAAAYKGQTTQVTVKRAGEELSLPVTLSDAGKMGVGLELDAPMVPVGVGEAAARAVRQPIEVTAAQLDGLWRLITGRLDASLQGPVGIVKQMARSADGGLVPFALTIAFISTLLGMFNLMPLPALDGGRLVFLGLEAVLRRPVPRRVEELVHTAGMLGLMLMLVWITVGDLRGR